MRTVGAGTTSLVKRAGWLGVDNGIAGLEGRERGWGRGSAIMKSCRHFRTRAPSPSTFLRVIELSNVESRVDIIGVEAS